MKLILMVLLILGFSTFCYSQEGKRRNLQDQSFNNLDSIKYVDALNKIGFSLYETNVDSAFKYVLKARDVSKRISYLKGIADATNTLGVLYEIKGDLQLSLRYYSDANDYYRAFNDLIGVVQTKMRIALVYNENGENEKSIRSFQHALSLGKKLEKDSIISLVLSNYLLLYADQISKDTIPVYLKKARQIAARYHDARIPILADQILAKQYIKQGDTKKGIKMLNNASNDAKRLNLNYLNLDILINLGDVLQKIDLDNALLEYKKGLLIAEQKGYLIYTKIIAKKLFDIYTLQNDLSNAQKYSTLLIDAYDKEDKMKNASGIDYIDYAIKDQELKSVGDRIRYKKDIITILLILFTAVVIIGVILYYLLRLKQKHSAALEKLNEMMRSENAKLETNHEFNNRLISILAHDFRQPLGVLKTLATLLKDGSLDQEEIKQLVESMDCSSTISLEIFENILQWIKRQLSGFTYEYQPLLLKSLIDEAVLPLMPLVRSCNLIINNTVDPNTIIHGDKELIQFINRNLIHNAIKFTPEFSEITIYSSTTDQKNIVSVKDEGKGISVEKLDRLFDFKKDLKYGSEKEKGAGVALMICKDFIQKINGEIWAENAAEKGAIFNYSLPILV
jgi:signal transduction histidine kinase